MFIPRCSPETGVGPHSTIRVGTVTNAKVPSETFDACYYAGSCGRPYRRDDAWLAFFGGIADRIASDVRPHRRLDAGCAIGLLVGTLRDRGIEAAGIDISAFAIERVYEPVRPFCRQASVCDPLSDRYDLIISIEVLEHMAPAEAQAAIANLCAHTDDVLFSSSPFDFAEATHTNVRPPEYWATEFARHGFYRDVDFDASFITTWAVRFRRRNDPAHRVIGDYERGFSQIVIERNELRKRTLDTQAEISRATHDALEAAERDVRESGRALSEIRKSEAEQRAKAAQLETQLAHAQETVAQMQRSWFWRARAPWAWLSRRFGRPT